MELSVVGIKTACSALQCDGIGSPSVLFGVGGDADTDVFAFRGFNRLAQGLALLAGVGQGWVTRAAGKARPHQAALASTGGEASCLLFASSLSATAATAAAAPPLLLLPLLLLRRHCCCRCCCVLFRLTSASPLSARLS